MTSPTSERERLAGQIQPILDNIKVTIEIQANTFSQKYIGVKTATAQVVDLILAEQRSLLDKVEAAKKVIPVHSGTDSYYPKEHIEAVPVSALVQLREEVEAN